MNEERSIGEMKIICTKLQQEIKRLRKYIGTLESELGIVKEGGKSSLAESMKNQALPSSASESSVSQAPASGGKALHELHGTYTLHIFAPSHFACVYSSSIS